MSDFNAVRAALLVMLHEAQELNMHVLREAGIGPFDLNAIRQAESALASLATSPASEAQAGWSAGTEDADGNPLVTVRADELRALAEFASGPGLSAWRIDGDMMQRDVLATRMQVVAANALASAPQPASSPVAAEGQKAVARLKELVSQKMVVEQGRVVMEFPTHLAALGWREELRQVVESLATPPASMADAAEAVAQVEAKALAERVVRVIEQAYNETEQSVPRDFCSEASDAAYGAVMDAFATPGPRGENAGGVVEALSREQVLQAAAQSLAPIKTGATAQRFANAIQRACATAWGLRIAEKGDDRG